MRIRIKDAAIALLLLIVLLWSAAHLSSAQNGAAIYSDCTTAPVATNSPGSLCFDPTNGWKQAIGGAWSVPSSGSGVPTGYDIVATSGTCPSGYTEDTSVQGFYLAGRTSTGTAGGTLGLAMTGTSLPDSSYTPSGSNGTASFTPAGTNGTASFTPAGTLNTPTFSATGTKFTTSGSGTPAVTALLGTTIGNGANTVTNSTYTFTGTAGTVPAETFTGTAGTVPAETFTGTANTTMRSVTAPAIQVMLCKKS